MSPCGKTSRTEHRRGVGAGRAGEGGVDLERPEPVIAANLVDDAEQRAFALVQRRTVAAGVGGRWCEGAEDEK